MLSELAYTDAVSGLIEQRRQKRWQLVNYLRVFDETNGQLLGHLIDLNEEGIMLLGTETLACEQEFQLLMERLSDGKTSRIQLRAHSLWSKQDADPNLYKTGFRLIDPDEHQLAFLKELIAELGIEVSETTS